MTLVQEGSSSGPHPGSELQCPGLPLPRGDVVVRAAFIWAELGAACGSFKQRGHLYREGLLLPAAPRGLSLASCPGDTRGLGAALLLLPGAGRVPARLGWGCTRWWFAGGLVVLHRGSAARAQPGCPGAGHSRALWGGWQDSDALAAIIHPAKRVRFCCSLQLRLYHPITAAGTVPHSHG